MTTTDSTTNTPTYRAGADAPGRTTADAPRRTTETKSGVQATETKSAFKTTKIIIFVLSVLGVLIAAAVTDNGDVRDPVEHRPHDQPRPGEGRQP